MRRIPDCAWCGKTLKRGPTVRIRYTALPGEPEVGWHTSDCASADPIALLRDPEHRSPASDIEGHLRTIQTRGAARISARKAWHEHIRLTSVVLWSVSSGVGCIPTTVDGHWVTTACGHWRTGDTQTSVPRRKCSACVGRLMRGELVPA